MSSINGVDPIIVHNIKVSTQKPAINETQRSKISEDKKDESQQQKKSRQFLQQDMAGLKKAVDKLNHLLDKNGIPLYFLISGDHPEAIVQLLSVEDGKIISGVQPGRIFELAVNFNTRGFTLDELI